MNSPLLLLHGALGSAGQFDKLIPLLPADWQIHTFNLPGHGGAPLPSDFSIPYFAEAVLRFLDKNNIAQTHIFGYSMGGYTALQLAAKYPERVQGIVTLGTKFHWTPEIASREAALLNAEKIAAKVPVFAELLATRHAPVDWREVLRRTAGLLHDLGNGASLSEDTVRSILCPVLIGLGSEDHMVTEEESREMAAQLPNGHFELLQGVKHPLEQVDPVFLAEWLNANLTGFKIKKRNL
ncbi:MAG: alpha/beta hydrolase [Lewinellaceae bacterium]|nr:alpha/beta hydrolase [Lewinellaceae bacterium]